VNDHQQTMALKAVAQPRGERDGKGRGQHPHQPDDADGERAAMVVGVDGERDEVGPVADVEATPGELQPSQSGVRQDFGERANRATGCGARAPTISQARRPF